MKLVFTTFFSLVFLSLSAQIQITDSLLESFFKKEIDDINLILFEAAVNQSVPVYANDSFSRTLSKHELLKKFSTESFYQITNRDDPNDIIDTTIWEPLDPNKDLKGVRLSYTQSVDIRNSEISYKVRGIGPRYRFIISGIDLGYTGLFYVEISDLNKILNDDDLLFLQAMLLQNSQLGDFRPYYVKEAYIDSLEVAYDNAVYSTQANQQAVLRDIDYRHKTPVISEYNRHVISVIMARIASGEIASHPPKNYLFKDIKLKKTYSTPERELRTIIKSSIINPYEGIVDLVDTTILCSPTFYKPFNYTVWQQGDDFIFNFIYKHGSDQPDDPIFMSFNAIKSLLPEQDRIIWEAFLKDLFTE